MAQNSAFLYLMCLFVKHTIANNAKCSIVRQMSIANAESKLWDGPVRSKIACSSHCFRDPQCQLGHYHPVSKSCVLYSSNALVCNPNEEGMVLIIEDKEKVTDVCGATSETGVVDIQGIGSVYCENSKHGGGWTVFQRRFDGSVDFYRNWENYKLGFGDINGEFWLGLEKLHTLTSAGEYMMRVDLQDYENNTAHAIYCQFRIGNEDTAYELDISGYSGNAGDSLIIVHNGMKFSTIDRDNDILYRGACAIISKGGWWYRDCLRSNLNGPYQGGDRNGFVWKDWKWYESLKATEMMIRRL